LARWLAKKPIVGGEDMIVLGTHLMDFMRYLAGDARWCFADVTEGGKPIGPKSVRRASEDIGPVAGDAVSVVFGFAPPTMGFFASHRAKHGAPSRYGIELRCTKAVIVVRPSPPDIRFCEDPEWNPGKTGAAWHTLSSAGIDAPEPLPDNTHHLANTLIARDLIGAVEQGREPEGSARDGRAALEMILAAYESRRQGKAVALPLENRRHPLDMIAGGVKAWP